MNITQQEIVDAIKKAREGKDSSFEIYKDENETDGGHDFRLTFEALPPMRQADDPVEVQACIYAPTASLFISIPPHTAAEWAVATIMGALEY